MQKCLNIVKAGTLVVVCLTLFSGCAVFSGGNVPDTVLAPSGSSDQQRPSITFDITAQTDLFGANEAPEQAQSIVAGEFLQTLEKSNYFSRISKNDEQADISLKIEVKNTGSPVALIPAVITGLSLYTIPSWATDNFEVTAVARNKRGLHKEYILTDSTTLVQWLPMLFVFPFKNFSVVPEVRKNMYRNILSQMKSDGFIVVNSTVKLSGIRE